MKKKEINAIQPRWLQAGETKERFEREASFAIQAYNSNGLLQKCTNESLLAAVFNVALTGLSLNPVLKYAALVPRWNSKDQQYEASLEPMYQGLIYLSNKSGKTKGFSPGIIYEGDDIDIDYSVLRKVLKHKPYFLCGKEQGKILAVYMIALLNDGTEFCEIMTWPEIEAIRDRSESWKAYSTGKIKSCVWLTDKGEMAKKTVLKRMLKYFDKGQDEKLAKAIQLDNDIHGFRPLVDVNQVEFLTHLIEEEIKVDDRTLNRLRLKLSNLTFRDEATALTDEIFANYIQVDENLGQTKLGKEIDKLVERENT